MSLQKGLVGHWTLDDRDIHTGTVKDKSPYNSHGELQGGTTPGQNGIVGDACEFDGSAGGDYIRCSGIGRDDVFEDVHFSASAWFYWYGGGGGSDGRNYVLQNDDSGGNNYPISLEIYPSNDQAGTWHHLENDGGGAIRGGTVVPGQWYHIATTYNNVSGAHKLYLDGEVVAEKSLTGGDTLLNWDDGFNIGTHRSKNNRWMDGLIDDVRVYNRTLTENEIKQLYNMRAPQNTDVGRIEVLDQEPTGSSHSNNYGPAIEAHRDITVYQWDVRPYFTGDLTFYLKEGSVGDDFSSNPRLEETTVSVVKGEAQSVRVNWDIDEGEYAIFREDSSDTPLMRSSTGYDFPATSTSGSVDVVYGVQESGSTADRYYYYFNWKLRNR